jgi:hypothetical protein
MTTSISSGCCRDGGGATADDDCGAARAGTFGVQAPEPPSLELEAAPGLAETMVNKPRRYRLDRLLRDLRCNTIRRLRSIRKIFRRGFSHQDRL